MHVHCLNHPVVKNFCLSAQMHVTIERKLCQDRCEKARKTHDRVTDCHDMPLAVKMVLKSNTFFRQKCQSNILRM